MGIPPLHLGWYGGVQGATGPQGPAGADGATGATGPAGPQGVPGADGSDGAQGVAGANGQGVPVGGTAGQVLAKIDGTDYNTEWAAPAGGGGAGQLVHSYVLDETTAIDTNAPAARRFFLNTHRYVMLLDLTDFTECRLVVNKQGVAGAASYKLCMEYRAAGFSTSVANYVDIGTSEVACACNVLNTIVSSGWIALAAGAQADVAVCVTSEGGDGVLDPQFGSIVLQFR